MKVDMRERAAISKFAIPVALIVVLAVAGAYVFVTQSPTTSTSTMTSTSAPTVPVRTAVDQLIQEINARNVESLVTFYGQNSVVVWSGNTGGLVGHYTGPSNIRLIYAASIGKTTTMKANVSNYAEQVFSPTHVNTTFAINMRGNSTVAGVLTALVNTSQEWTWNGVGWQIARENWAYKYFDASLIDANRGSATTFPQWGYMERGGNPNLVSEKSFEWNAGPLLAATVYALLFSAIAVLAVGVRRGDGGARRGEEKAAASGRALNHPIDT
jgi:hypothetical protein